MTTSSLPCYNKSKKELVDRLTGAMLISPKKCLKLVLVYIIRYKNKPQAVRNKAFRTHVDSKALTLKS